jgi:hypothetical protein
MITIFVTILFIAVIILFYNKLIKPNQDAKNKIKTKSRSNILPVEPYQDLYTDVINDYPTYHRNQKN